LLLSGAARARFMPRSLGSRQRLESLARRVVRPLAVVMLGRDRQRLAIIGQRLRRVALALIREPAARIGAGEIRIKADRLGVVRNGAVVVAGLPVFDRAIVEEDGEGGIIEPAGLDGARAPRDRGVAALLEAGVSVGIGICRRGQDDRQTEPGRNRQQAPHDPPPRYSIRPMVTNGVRAPAMPFQMITPPWTASSL